MLVPARVANDKSLCQPVSRTLLGSLQLVFRSLWSGSWQLQTLKSVQAAINTISTVQGSMQASQDEGSAKKIETADLAAKAAQHIAECSTLQARVSNAQRLTQASLDSTKRQISCAQEQIDECSRFSADMASKAAHHEKEAEGNKTVRTTPGLEPSLYCTVHTYLILR